MSIAVSGGGDAEEPPSAVYSLISRKWKKVPAGTSASWSDPPPVTQQSLQSVSVKGRSSHEEKEAWVKGAQLLLGSHAWQIKRTTEFAEVEQMVVVLVVRSLPPILSSSLCWDVVASRSVYNRAWNTASLALLCASVVQLASLYCHPPPPAAAAAAVGDCSLYLFLKSIVPMLDHRSRAAAQKYLEHWTPMESAPHAWCVGASLQATFDSRNRNGDSSEMHMVLCPKTDWTGNGRGKIGNTCKTCCDGVKTKMTQIGGNMRSEVELKKCTWLKCCYGRRPFGGTDYLPWSMRCEQQKKLLSAEERSKLSADLAADSGDNNSNAGAKRPPAVASASSKGGSGVKSRKRPRAKAAVPTNWPLAESLSPTSSQITPRGRAAAHMIQQVLGGDDSGRASPMVPSPTVPITPRGRAAAQVMANLKSG